MSSASDLEKLETPHLSLELLRYGHHFHSLVVKGSKPDSKPVDVLAGLADPTAYHHSVGRGFLNPIVGRYANRLPSGETKLNTGASLHLGGAEGVCLHGGSEGLDTLPWIPIARQDSTLFPLEDEDHPIPPPPSDPDAPITESSSVHRLISPGGADGFPCSLEIEALVTVYAPEGGKGVKTAAEGKDGRTLGKVKVVMRAKIREDGDEDIPKGTAVNLTVHWGFRLDNCQDSDALKHHLYIDSDKLVALDDKALASGEIEPIKEGDELDFFSHKREGPHWTLGDKYPSGGIDRNFLLSHTGDLAGPSPKPHLPTAPQVILTAPSSVTSSGLPRLSLRFTSSAPSVQVYTAVGLDSNGPARKAIHGGPTEINATAETAEKARSDGQGYPKDGIVFLEFHHPVGTVTHTAKQGLEGETELGRWLQERAQKLGVEKDGDRRWEYDTVLKKGQVYENRTEVEVLELSF